MIKMWISGNSDPMIQADTIYMVKEGILGYVNDVKIKLFQLSFFDLTSNIYPLIDGFNKAFIYITTFNRVYITVFLSEFMNLPK